MVQLSHLCIATGKTIALTIQTFVSKVMSLLFNTLSRFVITFLSRSKHLLISRLQSPSTVILEHTPPKKICHCFHFFLIYLPWSDWTGCHDLCLFMLSFQPAIFPSSFTLIKRHFSSSSPSAIRVVSSADLRLLTFLWAILIPTCDSSSPAFIHLPFFFFFFYYLGGWRGPRCFPLPSILNSGIGIHNHDHLFCEWSTMVSTTFPDHMRESISRFPCNISWSRKGSWSKPTYSRRHFLNKKFIEKRRHGVLFIKYF